MNKNGSEIGVFVLAKNEQNNIRQCLDSVKCSSWDVFVLDSGSEDNTRQIVAEYPDAVLKNYVYTNHCDAYNQITTELGMPYKYVVVLDADMVVSANLQQELVDCLLGEDRGEEVFEAKVLMCVEGNVLPYGSLYPPKPFVFKVGREYFVRVGHGEALIPGLKTGRLKSTLKHDDRKCFASFLQTQIRYAKNLAARTLSGDISGKDRIRVATPFLLLIVPFVSYILKAGFLSGRAGALYAMDRLIAEAIMYRQCLAERLDKTEQQ